VKGGIAMNGSRRGEKAGWIGGWLGSFLWVGLFACVWVARGRVLAGIVGGALFVLAVAFVFALAPWRHPACPFWKLALPLYGVAAAAVVVAIVTEGGFAMAGLSPWSLFLLLPVLMPLLSGGGRRWQDGGA
jgi:hypothetical protein